MIPIIKWTVREIAAVYFMLCERNNIEFAIDGFARHF